MPQEDVFAEITTLEKKVSEARVPEELRDRAMDMLQRLLRMAKYGFYSQEYEQASRYIDWICHLPWQKSNVPNSDL